MSSPSVLVLGGGLSGMATAYTLAEAGWSDITVLERGEELGGLAGTFSRGGHFYPLGYHHILYRDRTLLYFLDQIGALDLVRWRRIQMLFRFDRKLYNLAHPIDFFRFPISMADKFRFVSLMVRCFSKSDWTDWSGRSAAELIDRWGGPGVREALFESLCRIKFGLSCEEVSGAWLGARLHFREGSAPLGYIPGCNWTKVLCDGITQLLEREGVKIRLQTSVRRLHGESDRITEVELDTGETLEAETVVSTVPTEVYRTLVDRDSSAHLNEIRYTALVSAVCVTKQPIEPDFYWMNLESLDSTASGIFMLNSLNPSIGGKGESCINFVTHVPSRSDPYFQQSDEALMAGYFEDFERVFKRPLTTEWTHLSRVPMYSPVFVRSFENVPLRSTTWNNVYFAGNYRTFPSIASTGTALGSGLDAGEAILHDHNQDARISGTIEKFRLRSMPRG